MHYIRQQRIKKVVPSAASDYDSQLKRWLLELLQLQLAGNNILDNKITNWHYSTCNWWKGLRRQRQQQQQQQKDDP